MHSEREVKRRAQSGWHSCDYAMYGVGNSRIGVVDRCIAQQARERHEFKPKDWKCGVENCIECAKTLKVVEPSAKALTVQPAHDEELYEKMGTMPVVGDKFEWGGDVRTVSRIDPSMEFSVRFAYGTGEDGVKMDYFDQRLYEPLRILKRPTKPRDDGAMGARV